MKVRNRLQLLQLQIFINFSYFPPVMHKNTDIKVLFSHLDAVYLIWNQLCYSPSNYIDR